MTASPRQLFPCVRARVPRDKKLLPFALLACHLLCAVHAFAAAPSASSVPFAPVALARHGENILVLGALSQSLVRVNANTGLPEKELKLPDTPNGLAVNGDTAYVTTGAGRGRLHIIDLAAWKILSSHPLGHSPANLLAHDGTLHICDRFAGAIIEFNLQTKKITRVLPAISEPVALARPPGGESLWVCNLLPHGRADGGFIAAAVSVYEPDGARTDISLPNGAHSARGIAASPDGEWVVVTHILSRYALPATQVDKGWMNTNALTLLSVREKKSLATILLDDIDLGAPNPWAVAFTPDGARLLVTHAGAPEMSVIDFPELLKKITGSPNNGVSQQLGFLGTLRKREPLPVDGARALLADGAGVFVAGYFSDTLARRDDSGAHRVFSVLGGGLAGATPQRRGEAGFADARLCFQNWQSCVSCHPDARADALDWDLPNDGIGNPKNTRTMLFSHDTPPAMTLGVRADAETAVRKGFIHIQFVTPPEETAREVDAWLKSLAPASSPFLDAENPLLLESAEPACLRCHHPDLQRGKLTPKAEAGRAVFKKAGCIECHPHPWFTDMQLRDAGTLEGMDAGRKMDTPSLLELWRTAPYLHDGRAATLEEAVFQRKPGDRRGRVDKLTDGEKASLLEYLRSL